MMRMETDYLIIGSGAMGMAFADVVLSESDATVTIVDRRGRPGGHWNDAYPFVRLHQPSAFYGVNSRHLGSDSKDLTGGNAGLYELASGAEVLAYFDQVLNQQFLPSGRVSYFPMSRYLGDHRFESLVSGTVQEVEVRRKVVDATYMNVTVPAMGPPAFEVAAGARCVPLNELVRVAQPPSRYVVIGAGKTGMDACLWLLANDVDPDTITWVMPRDSWILDRAILQPGPEFAGAVVGGYASQMEAAAQASSIEDLFDRLEAAGQLLRIDPAVRPSMYRCATVTHAELEQLRRIDHIVRLGRVKSIGEEEIRLDDGVIPTSPQALHIDCTADGLEQRPVEPVFDADAITLQTVRTCQQVFSAAFIAHVELSYAGDDEKNELCAVVPHPNTDVDWLRTTLANTLNADRWRQDRDLRAWLTGARLDGFSGTFSGPEVARQHGDVLRRLFELTPSAIVRLGELLGLHDANRVTG